MDAPEVTHVHVAEAIRIIDGDTFQARVALDFHVSVDVRIRVRAYFAPELRQPGGPEAKQYLMDLLVGKRLTLRSYKDHMTFERWVCDVWIEGRTLSDWISGS